MKTIFKVILITFCLSAGVAADNQSDRIEIGIDEQLGKILPLDLSFKDEDGNDVFLRDVFDKPTVLAFVYYSCPAICSPLMSEIAEVVDRVNLTPGENYRIVTISINDREDYQLASQKKKNYLALIDKQFPLDAWLFLTGDKQSIIKATDAAGFYFKQEGDDFVHSGALIFVDKNGKICRYLFPNYSDRSGYKILPFDFTMAVTETAQGKEIPTVARFLKFCFSYDPEGRSYVLNLTRIFGAGILVLAIAFVLFLTIKPKKNLPGNSGDKNIISRGD